MLIDANAQVGPWPFSPLPDRSGAELARHLAESGVGAALVSHLGAVFLPEPMPANRQLFATLKRTPRLSPVPILNPLLRTWREQLAECRDSAPIKAVKLLPNYHRYSLAARELEPFVAAVAEARLKLVITVRLEDERHKYFALRIKGVANAELGSFLRRFPGQHPLLAGIYKPDLEKLAKEHENFSSELSFCEWKDTVAALLKVLPPSRLMLGTCAPLLSTRAEVAKLAGARIPARARALIGGDNARRFFGL